MDEQTHIDSELLMREIGRYLAAIEVFRVERCEPTWLAEAQGPAARKRAPTRAKHARSAH